MLYYYGFKDIKNAYKTYKRNINDKGDEVMGTIVCQECESTIGQFEDEKVTVLYSSSCDCTKHKHFEETK